MIEFFLAPHNASFAIAIGLMALIASFEVVGALMGLSPSSALDSLLPEIDTDLDMDADVDLDIGADADLDADVTAGQFGGDVGAVPEAATAGPLSQVLGWLCVGKVPILVLLVVFLTAFGLSGFVIQALARSVIGTPLPQLVAVMPAFLAAVPTTRFAGLSLSKIIPKEHTEAVSQGNFIGKVATVIRGEARHDLPAEAKLTDQYGTTHYILVVPDDKAGTFKQGTEVIVVKQSGSIYQAILNTSTAMTD